MFLGVLLACASAWVSSQLNWIRERQAMLREPGVRRSYAGFEVEIRTPWSLQLFGEGGIEALDIPESEHSRAQDLFPEAILGLRRGE